MQPSKTGGMGILLFVKAMVAFAVSLPLIVAGRLFAMLRKGKAPVCMFVHTCVCVNKSVLREEQNNLSSLGVY